MKKQLTPTTTHANLAFLILILVITAGSSVFIKLLGMGTNLWINEFIYILFPALLLARLNGWSLSSTYRYRATSRRNKAIAIFCGIGVWLFSFYVTLLMRMLLNKGLGEFAVNTGSSSIIQNILLLIGMVILAPICEETFFRGLMQRGYESFSKKNAFVFAGLLFGFFHILNGIEAVIPACIIGLVLGYLLHRSGSIYTSMLAHGANNASAVLLGGMFTLLTKSGVPVWLHFLGFAGLAAVLLLIRFVRDSDCKEETEQNEIPCDEAATSDVTLHKSALPVKSAVFLGLSVLLLASAGVIEILTRMGIISWT